MPVFLRGRRAFCIIPAPPTSPMQPLISPPRHQFVPRLPRCGHLSLLPSPRLPRCGCRLPLLPSLCLLRCRRFRIPKRRTDRNLSRLVRKAARPAPLLPSCPRLRHGPRPFCCSARGPRPGARGTKKGGRNRTEARPPPKSNQSVAAASPRQLFNPSGQCTRLKQTRSV